MTEGIFLDSSVTFLRIFALILNSLCSFQVFPELDHTDSGESNGKSDQCEIETLAGSGLTFYIDSSVDDPTSMNMLQIIGELIFLFRTMVTSGTRIFLR